MKLKRLGFPELFSRIAYRDVPSELEWLVQPVGTFYALTTALSQAGTSVDAYLPLWEENGDALVAYDRRRGVYIRNYFLDPDLGEVILGANYQQFVAAVLLEIVDSGITELTTLAQLFLFDHLPELEAFLETAGDQDFETANRSFLAALGT